MGVVNLRDQRPKVRRAHVRVQRMVLLALLAIAGYAGNYFRLPLLFGVDFIFGSIASLIGIYLFGWVEGALLAIVASSYTYQLWNHPFAAIVLIAEALFIGLLHRKRQSLLLLDGVYWVAIGMPLVGLFYAGLLHVDTHQVWIVMVKQAVNGIFNALAASLILTHVPFHQWMQRPHVRQALSFQPVLLNLLIAFVFFPTLALMVLDAHRLTQRAEVTMRSELQLISNNVVMDVQAWYQQNLQILQGLANVVAEVDLTPSQSREAVVRSHLQQSAEFIKRLIPAFYSLHITDKSGQMLMSYPITLGSSKGILDFDAVDKVIMQTLRRSQHPVITDMHVDLIASIPHVDLGVPIFVEHQLYGFVYALLNVQPIDRVLKSHQFSQGVAVTLLDSKGHIIASTQPHRQALQSLEHRKQGVVKTLAPGFYHWLPDKADMPAMVRWKNSLYVREVSVGQGVPWTLMVEMRAAPLVTDLQGVYTRNLVTVLLIALLAMALAYILSDRLARSMTQLAQVTTNLPDKLLEREAIAWPTSPVMELASLIRNVQSMAALLEQKFQEIQTANELLEQRVQERTQEWITANAELAAQILERQRVEERLARINDCFLNFEADPLVNINRLTALCGGILGATYTLYSRLEQGKLAVIGAWNLPPGYKKIEDPEQSICYDVIRECGNSVCIRHLPDTPYAQTFSDVTLYQLQTYVGHVVKFRGECIGALCLLYQTDVKPTQDDQRLLGIVAAAIGTEEERQQVEVARQQAEAALHLQAQRERLMGAMAQRIRQSLDLETILRTTVTEVRYFLSVDRVLIYQFEPDWHGVVAVESVEVGWMPIQYLSIQDPCFSRSCAQQYQQGRIRAIEDIESGELSPCLVDLLKQMQVRASLIVPILQSERLWGLLIAHHCAQPRQWQQGEIDFLQQLATQVAIAIQQSELYQRVQVLNADLESQVRERTAQLQQALEFEATLKLITDKVRDSLDEHHILQTAVQELAQVMEAGYCNSAMYEVDSRRHRVVGVDVNYEYTQIPAVLPCPVLPLAEFPEVYQQLYQGRCFQFCTTVDGFTHQWCTILICPMFDDQKILGDLLLFTPKETSFNELEIRLLQQVANQCAIAIRQARLYQSAQKQVEELERLNHLKDDFLCTVSHELRTPVSNIQMATQMMELLLNRESETSVSDQSPMKPPAHPEIARCMQMLRNESEREMSLINDLLDLQRLGSGTQPLLVTPIDLRDWLHHIGEPFEAKVQSQQQILEIDVPDDLPILYSDMAELGRVIAELLNNACKYTPAGGKIVVGARAIANKTEIRVCNSGAEIPAAELPRIFDKFYRIPSNDPWKHGGTGLGLALAQKIVEHLQGSIRVESASGQTCFIVELPLDPTTSESYQTSENHSKK